MYYLLHLILFVQIIKANLWQAEKSTEVFKKFLAYDIYHTEIMVTVHLENLPL